MSMPARKRPTAEPKLTEVLYRLGRWVVTLLVALGAALVLSGCAPSFHPNSNAIQACQDMQAGVADPSSGAADFSQAAGLAQAAANEDGTYVGFAGEVLIASQKAQQAATNPPLDASDTSLFDHEMSALQGECKSEMGVDLGITNSNSGGSGNTANSGNASNSGNSGNS